MPLSSLLPDLSPWRSTRDFRLLWVQGLVTYFGSFMAMVALPLQIKELTDSPLAVGAMGAVELVPLVVFGLYGGALADAVDRRKVILLSEAALGLLAVVLLVNALLPSPLLWPLYVVAAGVSALSGLQRPALDSLMARIVPHDQLTAAAALNSFRWNVGAIAGPSLAGLVVAYAGHASAYAVTVVGFTVSVLLCTRLSPAPRRARRGEAVPEGPRRGRAVRVVAAGAPGDVRGGHGGDVLRLPERGLPVPRGRAGRRAALGLMYAAGAVGSLLLGLTSGWTSRVRRHGLLVVFGAAGWGLAITAAGWFSNVWVVLGCLPLAAPVTW